MPHTPGPWRRGVGNDANMVFDSERRIVAERTGYADGSLIAAAPDYHTAVKELLELWPLSGHELEAYMSATFIPAVAEAFAKATQRS